MEIVDNNFLRQFETKVGGGLAIIEYSVQERKIFLTKIFVPEINTKDEFQIKIQRNLQIVFKVTTNFMMTNHEFFHDCLRTTDFELIITRDRLSALFVYWQKQHQNCNQK